MQKKLTAIGIILAAAFLGIYLLTPTAKSGQQFTAISSKEASALIEKHMGNSDFVILDIRTPGEYQSGHIDNSIMIDFYSKTFAAEVSRLDKEKTYLIYCRSGNRSGQTLKLIDSMGFQRVYHLKHGIIDWQKERLPLVKPHFLF